MADKTPDPQQEALFREVEEDLRHEQMQRLWKKYGGVVIGVAVLVVVVVAGYQGWNAWQASRQATDARAYEQAQQTLAAGQADAAAEQFAALGASGTTGHAALARLQRAAILRDQGRTDEALAAYEALAGDTSVDPVMRDMGRLLHAQHGIDHLPPDEIEARLAPLTAPNHAFRHSAREVQALLALRQGDTDTARTIFSELADDPAAPGALRGRAGDMAAMLGGTAD